MAKELRLYSPMFDFIADEVISQIDEQLGKEATLRLNSPGGSVFAANGFHAKLKEHGKIHLKVDGAAMSACAFTSLYCASSECLDVSRFILHRADMQVNTPEDQAFLDGINKDLKSKMKMVIDPDTFKKVTKGKTIEDLFDPTQRIEIPLTGKEAVEVGLIGKLTKLTPQIQKEISAFHQYYNVAAIADPKPTPMTVDQLKSEHPNVYAQIFDLGKSSGAATATVEEKERVEAWSHFMEVDAKAVKEGIASGKKMTQLQTIELTQKQFSAEALKKVEKDSPPATTTDTPEAKTAKEKEIADFKAATKSHMTYFAQKTAK